MSRVAPKYYFGLDGEEDDHLRVSTYVLDYFHELNLQGNCSHHIQCDQLNFEMNIEDYNDEHENSDEDEDSILLAAVVDDENEDDRKMPALPVAALAVATNKKQKKTKVTNKPAPNTRNRAKV